MSEALQAALTQAASAPIDHSGWLRITGADRVRWLNGMVTNSIQALRPGEGCYNFVLNAQGRIQADATAWGEPEQLLLQTADPRALATLLDRFIIMDDVELGVLPPTAEWRGLLLAGPDAARLLKDSGLPVPEPMHLARTEGLAILHAHSPLVTRFEIWGAPEAWPGLNLPQLSPDDLLQLRLLEGTPQMGVDIRDRDLPQETGPLGGVSRALHFSKGCYLGQEIVERIRSRGQVHRTLHGFRLEGELPPGGAGPLVQGEKSVGELTSAARVELGTGSVLLALGSVRRDALETGGPIHYPGGVATPAALPFPLHPTSV